MAREYSGSVATSGTWIVRRSSTTLPPTDSRPGTVGCSTISLQTTGSAVLAATPTSFSSRGNRINAKSALHRREAMSTIVSRTGWS